MPDDLTPAPAQPADAPEQPREMEVVVRRQANLKSFVILGAIVGVVLATILTFAFPPHPEFSRMQVWGFLLVFVTALSCVAFMAIALIANWLAGRRSGTVKLERVDDLHE